MNTKGIRSFPDAFLYYIDAFNRNCPSEQCAFLRITYRIQLLSSNTLYEQYSNSSVCALDRRCSLLNFG